VCLAHGGSDSETETAWLTHNNESLVCLVHCDNGSVSGTAWLTQS
jgi:hypothetical protein